MSDHETTVICYATQDELGNPITQRITREEAIQAQREAGLTKYYVYPNDATALADFKEIHWAWEEPRR